MLFVRDGIGRTTLIGLFGMCTAISASAAQPPLLRDGYLLQAVDGQISYDSGAQSWFFTSRSALSDERNTLPSGVKLPLLPSSALDALEIDRGQPTHLDYRLWARATQYEGGNYLFVSHYLPLSRREPPQSPPPQKTFTQNKAQTPGSKLGIPRAIQQRQASRRKVAAPSVASTQARKPNKLMLDRVGYLVKGKAPLAFALDGRGLQVQARRIPLLPCRLLDRMQQEQRLAVRTLHYRIAGLLTEYQGQEYLMVQQATQVHDYGNFGR